MKTEKQPAAWPFKKIDFRQPADDAGTLALARLGAAVLGDGDLGALDGSDIEEMAVAAGAFDLHHPAPGLCHTGRPRDETCSCTEYYGMDEEAGCYVMRPEVLEAIQRLTGGEV